MDINNKISQINHEFQRMQQVGNVRRQDTVQAPDARRKSPQIPASQPAEKTEFEKNVKMAFFDTALTQSLTNDEKAFISKIFQNEEINFSDGYTRGSRVTEKPKLGQTIDVKA